MPREAFGPRLYFHKQKGFWVIRDGSAMRSTGCRRDDRAGADQALARYILEKPLEPAEPQSSSGFVIREALAIYGQQRAIDAIDPERIGYAMKALLPFWGGLTVDKIRGETCRRYARERGVAASTIRRELGTLRASLRHCHREGYLTDVPPLWMPPMAAPRDRWLTREEASRLVAAAKPWPHLERLIIIALRTGSRTGIVRSLQWAPNTEGGHVDLEAGVLYRQPALAVRTKKRATPVRMPRTLVDLMRSWQGSTRRWLVEYNGQPLAKNPKRSWALARSAAGLGDDVTPHTLRHTAITWLCQKGVPIAEVSSFAAVTMAELERTYLHHHPDHQRRAAQALEH